MTFIFKVGAIFFTVGVIVCMMFFLTAMRWPMIITEWSRREIIFLKEPYKPLKPNMRSRMIKAAITVLMLSFGIFSFISF